MVVLGVLAATDSLVRAASATALTGRDAKAFYIVPLTDMLIFVVCLYSAFRARFNPSAHKRYIYVATTALLIGSHRSLAFAFRQPESAVRGDAHERLPADPRRL
jgi:hypothetical protein